MALNITTPVKSALRIPVGHILVCSKWRNSDLINSLNESVQILYEDDTGVLDFYPSERTGVVYLTEADLITNSTYKRKLAKLRKANKVAVLVIAERTSTSGQYFPSLQKYCMLELGFTLVPVPGQREAAGFLAQLVHSESHSDNNPFFKKMKSTTQDPSLLTTVQWIPKLGGVKAKILLEKFNSIQGICNATEEELSAAVGRSSAAQVRKFFKENQT